MTGPSTVIYTALLPLSILIYYLLFTICWRLRRFGCVLLLLGGSPAPDRLDFGMAAAYDSAEGVAILSGAGDDV